MLKPDGLGVAGFGEPIEQVIEVLEAALGPPTVNRELKPDSPSRTEVRAFWEKAGLHIGFSSYPFFRKDGVLHFTWWNTFHSLGRPSERLQTSAGVGWGTTTSDLMTAYPNRIWIPDDVCGPPAMIVPTGDVPGEWKDSSGSPRWIEVFFDQSINAPGATVSGMHAGISDGC